MFLKESSSKLQYDGDSGSTNSSITEEYFSSEYLTQDDSLTDVNSISNINEVSKSELSALRHKLSVRNPKNIVAYKLLTSQNRKNIKNTGNADSEKEISERRDKDTRIFIDAKHKSELYPKEKLKTLFAGLFLLLTFVATVTSLCLTHERLPDRTKYPPLPDVILDNVPSYIWALDLSEYIIMFDFNSILILLLFHKHRCIIFRRICVVMSILYLYRAITMYVTVLPMSNQTYPCAEKSNDISFSTLLRRVLLVMSGLGLSVNGKQVYCGDLIYSGHTVSLITPALVISEYGPEKLWIVHSLYWLLALLGICLLELAHGHYSIDIIVAYFVTTRIFWIYHSLANNTVLKQHSHNNHLRKLWWFKLFQYFEENVTSPVPNEYEWPFPWPKVG